MAKCSKAKELTVVTEDKPGMLAEVTSVIAGQGVNISTICAYGEEGKATFMMVASDNAKAKQAAASKGWKTGENDVVIVELVDKVGAAKEVADKLKAKNVNLQYIYGTTCTCSASNCACRMVLKADNNDAIIAALK